MILAVRGAGNARKQGTKSEVVHKWADWLRIMCLPGGPQGLRAGDKIRSGPMVGALAT